MNFAKSMLLAGLFSMSTSAFAENCGVSLFKFPQLVCGKELFYEHIYIVLHTRPGERVMRPEFGTNWDDLCFSPLTEEKLREMEAHLKDQIATNVGLDVVSVQIVPVGGEPPKFEIKVLYRTNEPGTPGSTDTMVIPFHCGE